jgi:putative ABC transport system permease protein
MTAMVAMIQMAFRNLLQSRARLIVSVGGVALAMVLILALDAIVAGSERQLTAYIEHSGADVIVSQAGVRTLHMSSSALPTNALSSVRSEQGVALVTPILYMTNMVVAGNQRSLAYVIGLPASAHAGGPWQMEAGRPIPGPGEAVIEAEIAHQAGVRLGDTVTILGRSFTVSGLATGTASLTNSVAFISFEDFAQIRNAADTPSFFLVKAASGVSPTDLAARLQRDTPGVTAQTREQFASQERHIVDDMTTDLVSIMNLVGFAIGLAVLALTVYTATLSRRAEYGVLKALGARVTHLYRVVLAQAFMSVALGFVLGLGLTLALAVAVPHVAANVALDVGVASLVKVGLASLVIAGISAILPVWQITQLDPAQVFKGR